MPHPKPDPLETNNRPIRRIEPMPEPPAYVPEEPDPSDEYMAAQMALHLQSLETPQ